MFFFVVVEKSQTIEVRTFTLVLCASFQLKMAQKVVKIRVQFVLAQKFRIIPSQI